MAFFPNYHKIFFCSAIFFLSLSTFSFAQIFPANTPCAAPTLTASQTPGVCNFNSFSSCCSSYTAFLFQPTCGTSSVLRDAWFEISGMNAGTAYNFLYIESGNRRTFVEIYELPSGADCGVPTSFVNVVCAQGNNFFNYVGVSVTATFVPPHSDSRYFARLQRVAPFLFEQGLAGDFCVVKSQPNDEPCSAILLQEQSQQGTQATNGSTVGAADHFLTDLDGNTCGTNNDVWYKFVASNCAVDIFVKNLNPVTYQIQAGLMTTADGNCNSPLTEAVQCGGIAGQTTDIKLTATNLTPGKIYWIVVDGWTPSYQNAVGNFSVEIVKKNENCPPIVTTVSPCTCGDKLSCDGVHFPNPTAGNTALNLAKNGNNVTGCFDLKPYHIATKSANGVLEFCYQYTAAPNEYQISYESVIIPKCQYAVNQDVAYDTTNCGLALNASCTDQNGTSKTYKVTPGKTYRFCKKIKISDTDSLCQSKEFESFCAFLWKVDTAVTNTKRAICQGDSVIINGNTYKSSGIYRQNINSGLKCDSVIILDLTVSDSIINSFSKTICFGKAISIGDSTYFKSGIYRNKFSSRFGCDSIIKLNLAVLPNNFQNVNRSICGGDSVKIGNKSYKTTGNYSDTLVAAAGCDSIIHLNLIVIPQKSDTLSRSICQGDFVRIGDSTFVSSGTYKIKFISSLGCDSIITLRLNIKNKSNTNIVTSLCAGKSVTIGNSTYNTAGNYQKILTNAAGCDSIVNLNLSYYLSQITQINRTICFGKSITIYGKKYDAARPSGFDTLQNSASQGCDSIIFIQIKFYPQAVKNINQTLCSGQSIIINGIAYNQQNTGGTQVLSGQSSNGCDSTINVSINFINSTQSFFTSKICVTDSIIFNGKRYSFLYPSGKDTLFNGNSKGCDSVINVQLSFFPPVNKYVTLTLCSNESINVNNVIYNSNRPSGVEKIIRGASNGCDSTIFVNLTFVPSKITNITASICPNELFKVGDSTYTQAGNYIYKTTSTNGCDSIIFINLLLSPAKTALKLFQLCKGESVQVGNKFYNQSGTYIDTLKTLRGCDSVQTSILIIYSAEKTISDTICAGQNIVIAGKIYNISGTYTDTIYNAGIFGCDSIVRLNLTVLSPISILFNVLPATSCPVICDGAIQVTASGGASPYDYSWDTPILTGLCVGIYNLTVTDSKNCKSYAAATINPASATTNFLNINLCDSDSVKVGSKVYKNAGNYIDTLQKANGCDSIIVLKLTKTVELITLANAVNPKCNGDKNGLITINTSGNNTPYQFSIDDGVTYTTSSLNPFIFNSLGAGIYKVRVKTANGCEFSLVSGQVILGEPEALKLAIDTSKSKTCVGSSLGVLTAKASNGFAPFSYQWSNAQSVATINNLSIGTYFVTATSDNGCKTFGQATVTNFNDFSASASPPDTLILLGKTATIQISTTNIALPYTVKYSPQDGIIASNNQSLIVKPSKTTTYKILITDANGCGKEIEVLIRVNEVLEIQIPNAFSPDGDGQNDVFRLVLQGAEPKYSKFQIWNRFGQLIYNNAAKPEWDGTFDGLLQTPDVFAYVIEYVDLDGKNQILKGQVTLLR